MKLIGSHKLRGNLRLNPFEFRAGLKQEIGAGMLANLVLIPLNSGLA